jgi:hypothetical protein
MTKEIEVTRLDLRFDGPVPWGMRPQDVRRIVMGLVDDRVPEWEVIANHRLVYPRLHYRLPRGDGFCLLGVEDAGRMAVLRVAEAMERAKEVVMGDGTRLALVKAKVDGWKAPFGRTAGLKFYDIASPLHFFSKGECLWARGEDVHASYASAMERHVRWLCRQFDEPEPDRLRVVFDGIEERSCSIKREMVSRRAASRGRMMIDFALPPAVGHGVGLGWGVVRGRDIEKMFS